MAWNTNLYRKVAYILNTRAVTFTANSDFRLVDHSDGNGAQIDTWGAGTLGAPPTKATLLALDTDPAFASWVANETKKLNRPDVSRTALLAFPALKTILTEDDATTLSRPQAQQLKFAVLGLKHLLRIKLNDEIDKMKT